MRILALLLILSACSTKQPRNPYYVYIYQGDILIDELPAQDFQTIKMVLGACLSDQNNL